LGHWFDAQGLMTLA